MLPSLHSETAEATVEAGPPIPAIHAESFTEFSNYRVAGVAEPVVSLNGRWEIALASASEVLSAGLGKSSIPWRAIDVPGEALMQGVVIKPDTPFCYRRSVSIPRDFHDGRILLCFDGVYSDARVFVDGKELGNHVGGFTPWAIDLTAHAKPGETLSLLVEVMDRRNEVSYASGYAKHLIGGILRSVRLRFDPAQRIEDWRVTTPVDLARGTAEVRAGFAVSLTTPARLRVRLTDPSGREVEASARTQGLAAGARDAAIAIAIPKPFLWTAETPHLYTLEAALVIDGRELQAFSEKIGIRQIEVVGERVLVNGMPVKLRGACRHDIHPHLGRVSTPDYDERDVQLAKEANLNFIRTAHYPPARHFLEMCDRYGIYVEVETAMCFINTWRAGVYAKLKQAGPEFREEILRQVRDMERDGRNHPSVLLWSIGNESRYDENVQASYDSLKASDPTRPVIWSYPGTVPAGKRTYDVISFHYPDVNKNGRTDDPGFEGADGWGHPGFPALYDEWAHIPCYARAELLEDPNIRDFWGQSIDRMWQAAFAAPGALGGAIWGMIDETFALPADLPGRGESWGFPGTPGDFPGPVVGYGEWGFVDVWRRTKPEFWHVKKAYSPVRLRVREAKRDAATGDWLVPLANRHDHLDLAGFSLRWIRGDDSGTIPLPVTAPHTETVVRLPKAIAPDNGLVRLVIIAPGDREIDEETFGSRVKDAGIDEATLAGELHWEEVAQEAILHGPFFTLRFSKQTGLLLAGLVGERVILRDAPRFSFRAADPVHGTPTDYSVYPERARDWKLQDFKYDLRDGIAQVGIEGLVDETHRVTLQLTIAPSGRMDIHYRTTAWPGKVAREIGVVLGVTADCAAMSWERDTYWTAYPPNHPARASGTEMLRAVRPLVYRDEPKHPWWQDDKEFFLLGLERPAPRAALTKAARSTRENVRRFALRDARGAEQLVVSGDGTIAVRVEQTSSDQLSLHLLNHWSYPNIRWGNLRRPVDIGTTIEEIFTVILPRPRGGGRGGPTADGGRLRAEGR